jgi:hypothetical protein
MTFQRTLGLCAIALTAAAGAAGAWLDGAGTARAPEPARLTQPLAGTTGATAAAVFLSSSRTTTVINWPASFTGSRTPPAAGQPCSTGGMPAGGQTVKVIQSHGNYYRCV